MRFFPTPHAIIPAMQIIEWPEFLAAALPLEGKPSAITVGVFDGVHRGHAALIERVVSQKECAAAPRAVPMVITFIQSHHKKARGDRKYPGDIVSFRQKMAIFESLGVSVTIVVEFSESFRRMGGLEFLRILQERASMGFMAVGGDFRCGYQLDTDASAIQEFNARRNIPTCIVQPLKEGGEPISSSQIRAGICRGKLGEAAAMLGRPFTIDLAGASVSSVGSGFAYDIAGQGRILPPPGKYPVVLIGKNGDRSAGVAAEIQVAGGSIVISGDAIDGGAGWEYVEVLA